MSIHAIFMTHFSMLLKKVNCRQAVHPEGNEGSDMMGENQRGFSMVEVITATVIVSILATGVFATTSLSKRTDVTAQQKLIAMSKVEEQMNILKRKGSLAVTLPPSGDSCPSFSHPPCQSLTCSCVSGELNGTMNGVLSTIVSDTVPIDPKAKEVVVRFDWKDTLGADRSVSAATYMQE